MNKKLHIHNGLLIVLFSLAVGCSSEEPPSPPEAPLLLAPNNGENCNTGTSIGPEKSSVVFSWSEGANATSYTLSVVNMQTQSKITREGLTTTSVSIDLDKRYPYQWSVSSVSSDYPADSPSSAAWRFYLPGDGESNSAPFPAQLLSPSSGESIQLTAGNFQFQWSGSDPDGDALTYSLYVDKVDGKQTPVPALTNLTSTSLDVALDGDSVYYWRVYSEDTFGNYTYSQIRTFRVE